MLEIGAGLGSLTLALAETGAAVVAVETDRHLVPVLRSVVEPVGVEVVEGDALTLDLAALLAERRAGPWSLVANLPYNVATPLVLRTLVEVPAVAHLLVMVQREVGERMAAAPGEDAYGAVSVRIAYFARAEVVGRVPASVFVPRPRVESVLVRLERLPGAGRRSRRSSPTNGWTRWCGPASPSGARCSGARWPASSSPRRSSGPACGPTPGPRSSAWPSGAGWRRREHAVLAPAKLTVSLRVTGVRADGYHELDAEMVTLEPGRRARVRRGRVRPRRRGRSRACGPTTCRAGRATSSRGRSAACGRTAAVRLTKRIPLGGGLGGGSADAAAVLRWAGCADPDGGGPASAPTCPSASSGGRARVEGVGERVTPLPFEAREYLLLLPPFGVDTARVYRAWDEDPRDDGAQRARPRPPWPSSRAWPAGATPWGTWPGSEPALAGSGSTWFVEGGPAEAGTPAQPDAAMSGPRRPGWCGPAPCRRAGKGTEGRSGERSRGRYLPARRCQRVAFSIFLCFFLRIRLRRFLISDPMSCGRLAVRGADCQVGPGREEAADGLRDRRGSTTCNWPCRPAARTRPRRSTPGCSGSSAVPKPAPLAARGGCWFAPGRRWRCTSGVEEDFRPARKAHPAFVGPRPARPRGRAAGGRGGGATQSRTWSRAAVPTSTTRSGTGSSSSPRSERGRGGAGRDGGGPPPPATGGERGGLGATGGSMHELCAPTWRRWAIHKKERRIAPRSRAAPGVLGCSHGARRRPAPSGGASTCGPRRRGRSRPGSCRPRP